MKASNHEMSPKELALRVSKFSSDAPINADFEDELIRIGMSDVERRWYRTQKEHWLGWLSEYDSPGFYDRKTWQGKSAKYIYNHIMNPAMLLWFCEAAGSPPSSVRLAKDAALSAKRTYPSQCAAIRKVIPWEHISTHMSSDAPPQKKGK